MKKLIVIVNVDALEYHSLSFIMDRRKTIGTKNIWRKWRAILQRITVCRIVDVDTTLITKIRGCMDVTEAKKINL